MQRFVESIRRSLQTQNWFAAIFMSLAMPDICGALEHPAANVGERYRDWFTRYLAEKYTLRYVQFTAQDCYKFRCKCLHQGLAVRDNNEKFSLTPPIPPHRFHLNSFNGVIQLQIDILCEDICLAVEEWARDVEDNNEVQNRILELINIHFPQGFIDFR
ncbi:TPA: hypothetical protein ACQZHX_001742 [Enterobacter sichuanensis]|uniref:hypothetical protein n=1 Tax=Enterobacter kobei TaxID=208224 RepID=UPI00210E062D|nr:hypothetical protein [Enterobacter kobei]MCQ4353313.1 hypothetical protein [Enterobacter kobei]HDR2331879.1 hypothetical protein [Enterobacter kobei]